MSNITPNWAILNKNEIDKEEFWSNLKPNKFNSNDLFFLKSRTKYILGGDTPFFIYWFISIFLFCLSWISYLIYLLPVKPESIDYKFHCFDLILCLLTLIIGIALIPYSLVQRKKQLKQQKILKKAELLLDDEIQNRDTIVYLNKYQKKMSKKVKTIKNALKATI